MRSSTPAPQDAGRPARSTVTAAPRRTVGRLILLLAGGISLLAGLDGALLLLGLSAPVVSSRLADVHGPLMVFGFVGTVVVLERAVAIRRRWAFLAPALLGAGGLALLSPLPLPVGQLAFVAGSALLLPIYRVIWRRAPSTSTAVQALGALLGLMATVLWVGGVPTPRLIPAMSLYLVLTIAGERLELARISPSVDDRAEARLLGVSLAMVAGVVVALFWPPIGYPLLGIGMLALVAWLFRHDVATRLIRSRGLPRYMAACLLAGYGWLVVAGASWLILGPIFSGPAYDAVLHSIFLGFVVSMIMAHAPTILPAVLRRPLPYRPVMYGPAVLLHVSLLARILLGDAHGLAGLVEWGGVVNIVAVLSFVVVAVASVLLGMPRPPSAEPSAPRSTTTSTSASTTALDVPR
ncbi:hypothetical protein QMG61_00775 [Cryobacterium sp. PH31-AA6]|uniref:hypothetical protein n=1 Tax=Cryobacterium sp. PH31-AA6 TaxID=3046205 RepID=UPI0024BA8951|nr:hypothetical protein [Cryobacterium sp. PH31-AA6]MDJ0322298.1 hypothetical protein [Cryobacterium sp. PH31-AA6]